MSTSEIDQRSTLYFEFLFSTATVSKCPTSSWTSSMLISFIALLIEQHTKTDNNNKQRETTNRSDIPRQDNLKAKNTEGKEEESSDAHFVHHLLNVRCHSLENIPLRREIVRNFQPKRIDHRQINPSALLPGRSSQR